MQDRQFHAQKRRGSTDTALQNDMGWQTLWRTKWEAFPRVCMAKNEQLKLEWGEVIEEGRWVWRRSFGRRRWVRCVGYWRKSDSQASLLPWQPVLSRSASKTFTYMRAGSCRSGAWRHLNADRRFPSHRTSPLTLLGEYLQMHNSQLNKSLLRDPKTGIKTIN